RARQNRGAARTPPPTARRRVRVGSPRRLDRALVLRAATGARGRRRKYRADNVRGVPLGLDGEARRAAHLDDDARRAHCALRRAPLFLGAVPLPLSGRFGLGGAGERADSGRRDPGDGFPLCRRAAARPRLSPGRSRGAATAASATIVRMADRAALERDLEEIGTRLAWVRDYL